MPLLRIANIPNAVIMGRRLLSHTVRYYGLYVVEVRVKLTGTRVAVGMLAIHGPDYGRIRKASPASRIRAEWPLLQLSG
jgi:hypothetical protein